MMAPIANLGASWVSTKGEAMSMDEMMRGGFMKLFNYISGSNAAKSKIDMTSPVLTKIEPGQGPACNSKFTVNFYVPGSGSPAPTEAGVFLSNLPAMEVYVAAYGGYSSNDVAKAKAAEAMEALKAAGEPFDASYWFVAGYDSPYSVIGRHNEVWIPKKQ
ncbi:hypothetical protein Rsub_02587 [Raphidocelis subcapitata]|uniref:SOUL heme-binding protein n=1 Tax=Raphidocelis subcapitata TaxID=307507 RepID=A0A2V0NWE4_9CHLO|nr:hypothetical protein Rsub_02587 [Raphidocelis subcapitata]|eukprot:GBF89883.1 hypothetical protein Rsub_02587 [Raphidocelis subcapitata]